MMIEFVDHRANLRRLDGHAYFETFLVSLIRRAPYRNIGKNPIKKKVWNFSLLDNIIVDS